LGIKLVISSKTTISKKRASKINLNKSLVGCAPCFSEAMKVKKKINRRSFAEIKKIVNSIFEQKNNVN